jgi:hypothetical protein
MINDAFLEEGDSCPVCHHGKMDWPATKNCICHINPPCSACTDKKLTCQSCGYEDDPPKFKDVCVAPGLLMREYAPRPFDKTKVDYRTKSHTGFSMIKYGVYPSGMSREDVEKVVKGTFGGRFTNFGNGEFEYIAYTD